MVTKKSHVIENSVFMLIFLLPVVRRESIKEVFDFLYDELRSLNGKMEMERFLTYIIPP